MLSYDDEFKQKKGATQHLLIRFDFSRQLTHFHLFTHPPTPHHTSVVKGNENGFILIFNKLKRENILNRRTQEK